MQENVEYFCSELWEEQEAMLGAGSKAPLAVAVGVPAGLGAQNTLSLRTKHEFWGCFFVPRVLREGLSGVRCLLEGQ